MTDLRALDARIAERLFGFILNADRVSYETVHGRQLVERYSLSATFSWWVVERMRALGYRLVIKDLPEGVLVLFRPTRRDDRIGSALVPLGEEPRGICEAALAALGDA